ncbi:MAG: sulfide/dihydroorotate dehydrogenase-like FAD/NAD-binding protein [Deltaproteobacteria bacterium]|uniref:Sulfide/dihydroorotate dehydrogenase-like FAD/NAD-binding protein n=1 Tax=Candidatus Zymogenus saltonus TaxID=2844893 RepID=A0A9D8PMJ5_9DELT|nr:sulfide/dihydroorotate dehydrogenase-like FAD/NAD-binding protein [Candidatus Zymogenus saltonus]
MAKILKKERLSENTVKMVLEAPLIAEKRKAGQFVVLRINEQGERIPLTIANADKDAGTITIIFMEVGKTTSLLGTLKEGDNIMDLAGPLGNPTHIEKLGTVVCVGGGVGIAPMYPITEAMKKAGNRVITIIGAKNKDSLIMEEEMKSVSDEFLICTDDGSYGTKGFVTQVLEDVIKRGEKIDVVVAIGPVVMMKAVSKVTRPHNIKTIVSLNSIMVDATGMCGGCRVSIGGVSKFACVEGPEFDGHEVDFDELMTRQSAYGKQEHESMQCFLRDKK